MIKKKNTPKKYTIVRADTNEVLAHIKTTSIDAASKAAQSLINWWSLLFALHKTFEIGNLSAMDHWGYDRYKFNVIPAKPGEPAQTITRNTSGDNIWVILLGLQDAFNSDCKDKLKDYIFDRYLKGNFKTDRESIKKAVSNIKNIHNEAAKVANRKTVTIVS